MNESCRVCGWVPPDGMEFYLSDQGKDARCKGLVFVPADGWLRRMSQCGNDLWAQAERGEG